MNANNGSKSAVIISTIISKIQIIFGGILTLFGVVGLFELISQPDTATIITMAIFLLLAILILYKGLKRGKLIKLFKNYVQRLSTDYTHSLTLLADSTGTSVDVVKSNLQGMINKKYFANAYIDEERNCIVFPQPSEVHAAASPTLSKTEAIVEYQTIICKGCGAANKIPVGSDGECEFCGSRL